MTSLALLIGLIVVLCVVRLLTMPREPKVHSVLLAFPNPSFWVRVRCWFGHRWFVGPRSTTVLRSCTHPYPVIIETQWFVERCRRCGATGHTCGARIFAKVAPDYKRFEIGWIQQGRNTLNG